MRLPLYRVLVLFSCIAAAFAQKSNNSTNTKDEDDGSLYSTPFAIFLFSFLGLLVPLTYLVVSMSLLVRIPCDVSAYCCGYRILPEEEIVGEPFVFRDRARERYPLHHGTLPDTKHV
jgi:hypothetical protein